jgi:hypothetical protein
MSLYDDIRDYLEDLPEDEVAAWYLRLAKFIEQKSPIKDPLAPRFLTWYFTGQGKKLTFDAPEHLRNSEYVIDVLADHRSWYLTEEKFKKRWVGVIPRLQGQPGFLKWSGPRSDGSYGGVSMNLQSLVEIPVKIFGSLSDGDFDLLTALHGFQLRTDVHVDGRDVLGGVWITFSSFFARARDRYDWDPDKHFTVPNPDYNNPFKVPNPVAPERETIVVYHKNAIRVEKVGKAWPYDLESEPWTVTDLKIIGPAIVDPNKSL